jgi:hypothetical protein
MRRIYSSTLAGLLLVCSVWGQNGSALSKRLTNQDIISMVGMGLSDDVIIAKIRSMSAAGADSLSFDTSVEGMKALKAGKVSDSVIKVMLNPAPPPQAINIMASTPMTVDPNLPPPEVGVYWKDGPNFIMLPGQALTQTKAGGRAGSIFTDGLRNQHWDAYVEGPTSKNVLKERRPTFYLYVPDGDTSSDYVLIKLNQKGNRREFQVGSFGGITGGKSGVQKEKELPFTAEHMGIRIYKITLTEDLKPGQYAFFKGTGQSATMSGAMGGNRSGGIAAGRIYDFGIPE